MSNSCSEELRQYRDDACAGSIPAAVAEGVARAGRRECLRCGYSWTSIVDTPARCPNCSSFRWNDRAVRLSCLRCGHSWAPRKRGIPARCPDCRSVRWNDPVPARTDGRSGSAAAEAPPSVEISWETRMTVSQVLDEARGCDIAVLTILTEIRRQKAAIIQ